MTTTLCQHSPRCPCWRANDACAARIIADQPLQGWSLLCNGLIVFDDLGVLQPDACAATRETEHVRAPGTDNPREPVLMSG